MAITAGARIRRVHVLSLGGARPPSSRRRPAAARAAASKSGSSESGGLSLSPEVVVNIAVVMGLGVANRVLYKMVLNPLQDYVFFLAQFQTWSYIFVYFGVLGWKLYGAKSVGWDQIEVTDKRIFLLIGAAEALSQVLGFIGAANLPGVVLPLISQSILLWQIALSRLVLGRRLALVQLGGALLVGGGVVGAAWPGSSDAVAQVAAGPALLYAGSMFFPALSSIFKERLFSDAADKLGGGRRLDLFAVNSFGSAAQALCVLLLLPVLSSQRGITFSQLPQYLNEGLQCMLGQAAGCESAPLLASAYVACNLGFNIALLRLLRSAGNVVQSLTLAVIVPLTIAAFTLDLPFLEAAPSLSANFYVGSVVMFGGILAFNSPKWLPALQQQSGGKKRSQ